MSPKSNSAVPATDFALLEKITDRLADLADQHKSVILQNATLNHKLRAAELARIETLAQVAHEVKKPLTVMRGLLFHLSRGHQSKIIGEIDTEIERLSHLLDNLISLTQLELGRTSTPIRINLSQTCQMIWQREQDKNPDLVFRAAIAPKVTLLTPPEYIYEILENLIQNAIKYTPAGGEINLTLKKTSKEILLSIRDTGIGIAEREIPKILEPFSRARSARKIPGSGLGLAIVSRAVVRLGGELQIASRIKQGSCFSVRIPVAPVLSRK